MTSRSALEHIETEEPEIFEKMVALTIKQLAHADAQGRRAQHAKSTGCVSAIFEIASSIPEELRHGVFSEPGRKFQDVVVRFSNAQDELKPDDVGTARGMAIKLKGVDGSSASSIARDGCQDFLLVNHPVFVFPTPKTYLDIIGRKSIPLVGNLFAIAHLLLLERDELAILKEIRAKQVANPLEATYWSGSPYWLGDAAGALGQAVKYSAVSRQPQSPMPEDPGDNYLSEALAKYLKTNDAVFDFKIQVQRDVAKMPIEDTTVEWSESVSPPVTVATLTIPAQAVDERSSFAKDCEAMAFNPWHALAEHTPLGGINRLRKAVYPASVAERTKRRK